MEPARMQAGGQNSQQSHQPQIQHNTNFDTEDEDRNGPQGFTSAQLDQLRKQIYEFRGLRDKVKTMEDKARMDATPEAAPQWPHAGPSRGQPPQASPQNKVSPPEASLRPMMQAPRPAASQSPLQAPQQQPKVFQPSAAPGHSRPHSFHSVPVASSAASVPGVFMPQGVSPQFGGGAGLAGVARPPAARPPAAQPRPTPAPLQPPPSAASLLQVPAQVPAPKLEAPLYSLVSGSKTLAGEGPIPREQLPALACNVADLLRRECSRLLQQRLRARQAELQELLKTRETCPGFVKVGRKLPKGSIKLELKSLSLLGLQASIRAQVEREQAEIMNMSERAYRKFARNCQASRSNFDRTERHKPDVVLERVRAVKAWKTAQQERFVQDRDMRIQRNRHVMRTHERLSRQHSKLKDDDRTRRMDALRANDFEAYQELLREQGAKETQGERYEVITKFLNDTEEYLHKLAGKVSNVKLQQEASEAFTKATAEARAMGFTDDEVAAAANQAAKEAAASSELSTQAQLDQGDAQSRYYSLAHSVEEVVKAQPAMLQGPGGAKLREYQLVGLQWMVSLYNNRLNGILADEMGLGKTVQVMALLAFLMENKNVFGPHLIIVPNAVIVNWKSELTQWLPDVRCVYYVGNKEERARKFATEVQSLQFNVLVTTYEFIMRDRAKLCKVDWKYIVIDEAQRMKDRQSKLAKDLDRFTASRRLLLTGTPLQNELRELWSLLNLLLPEVFDDKSTFTEWFGDSLGKASEGSKQEDEWLETEKRVVVIHRLHQILEPFMLRRQVEDVESKLPPKVAAVIKVAMPPYQAVIYDWVKETGTLRADPEGAIMGRGYKTLNNKCMELRKVCNHPALSYPPMYHMEGTDLVGQSGKFAVLDRMLVKLHAGGHRVLLFSTMTRLLDLLEHYLRWRRIGPQQQQMGFLRIDGSTSLEERERAIQKFNAPGSDTFIFLLSIRAAGRGLNLQSADTVIIYDPDPNPKNEEQAIARSHRIGQTKEVRVFHLEMVAGSVDNAAGSGKPGLKFADSIESLVRNNIQKTKIDMANEVIDAGRFNMATTQEERKETLEALLQDEERMKKAVNKVPTPAELNRMLARSPKEVDLFDKLDAQPGWPALPGGLSNVPAWLLATDAERQEAIASNSKVRMNANAEMAAAAARNQPTAKRKRTTGHYFEPDDSEFLEPGDDGAPEVSVSRSGERSGAVDMEDMEEEETDGNVQAFTKAGDRDKPYQDDAKRLRKAAKTRRNGPKAGSQANLDGSASALPDAAVASSPAAKRPKVNISFKHSS